MHKPAWVLTIASLAFMAACEANLDPSGPAGNPPAQSQPVPAPGGAPSRGDVSEARTVSRTIDSDLNADGIADSRIIIQEHFDEAGNLIRRVEEEDFDADGIVDTQNVTNFGAWPGRLPD